MSLKNDARAECDRLQYLLDNYCFDEYERSLVKSMLENAKQIKNSYEVVQR